MGVKPGYVEEKNGKYLIIWPDVPNWIVADKELLEIIQKFDSKTSINEIIETSFRNNSKERDFEKILSKLLEIGVAIDKNKKRTSNNEERKIMDVCIHPTLKCNLRCKMCYNKYSLAPKKELDTEEIKEFLDQVSKFISKKCFLSILGGEPLLVPNKTLSMAEYARTLGFYQRAVSTNGTLVTKEFAKKAREVELEVQVSIDGVNEEDNDRIRGKGSFKKTIEGIKKLKEEEAYTVLSMVYHSGNFHNLEKFYDLALKLGVDEARFAPLKYIGGGRNDFFKKIPFDEMIKYSYNMFKRNPNYLKLAGRDHFSTFITNCKLGSKTNYCGTGQRMVLLDSDGEIYPCINHHLPEFKAGNIRKQPFSEIWLNSPILNKLRTIYPVDIINEKCSRCIVRRWCIGGCRGETYHVTGKLNESALDCKSIKSAILQTFWLLSGETSFT